VGHRDQSDLVRYPELDHVNLAEVELDDQSLTLDVQGVVELDDRLATLVAGQPRAHRRVALGE
jgi:hypothetical protein